MSVWLWILWGLRRKIDIQYTAVLRKCPGIYEEGLTISTSDNIKMHLTEVVPCATLVRIACRMLLLMILWHARRELVSICYCSRFGLFLPESTALCTVHSIMSITESNVKQHMSHWLHYMAEPDRSDPLIPKPATEHDSQPHASSPHLPILFLLHPF